MCEGVSVCLREFWPHTTDLLTEARPLTAAQDHSAGEIKRVVATLLCEESLSHSVVLAVQQLTSVLISRHETSTIVRGSGPALLAKMQHFLQLENNIHEPSRNDYYYLMIWM
jgi:hypothetical protein